MGVVDVSVVLRGVAVVSVVLRVVVGVLVLISGVVGGLVVLRSVTGISMVLVDTSVVLKGVFGECLADVAVVEVVVVGGMELRGVLT